MAKSKDEEKSKDEKERERRNGKSEVFQRLFERNVLIDERKPPKAGKPKN